MKRKYSIFLILSLFVLSCQKEIAAIKSVAAVHTETEVAESLAGYLTATYSSSVTDVTVTEDEVTVRGVCVGSCVYALVDVAPYEEITVMTDFPYMTKLDGPGEFTRKYSRYIVRDGVEYDRAFSRWAIVRIRRSTGLAELVSSARYADSVTPVHSAEAGVFSTKKGLGAGRGELYWEDIDELQAGSITVNIQLTDLFHTTSTSGCERIMYGHKNYWIDTEQIAKLDAHLMEASARGVVVSAIILVPVGSVLADPENDGGYYAMPDLTSAESVNTYAAILNYIADRYSTGAYGRIHYWIMHNEVDDGYTWTNMGVQPEEIYMDRYVKSMRLCWNIVRQYDQNASVLASFAHSWYSPIEKYTSYNMLGQLVKYSLREGDFNWGVAYHPYPYNLNIPYFWSFDPQNDVTFSRLSPYVTCYNPEVIDDWILQTAHRHSDGRKRLLLFSEQGVNARYDVETQYLANELAMQAAGAAWLWKKSNSLVGVDAVMWHAWKDGADGGLNLGLRRSPGYTVPNEKKEVYNVWKYAATDMEDEILDSYLPALGREDWDCLTQPVN